jgi:pyruvate,water dikinase
MSPSPAVVESEPVVAPTEVIGTKLLVNLSTPDRAEEAAALPVDGVGLLRAKLMLTEALRRENRISS